LQQRPRDIHDAFSIVSTLNALDKFETHATRIDCR
jgi:hypothetical protein